MQPVDAARNLPRLLDDVAKISARALRAAASHQNRVDEPLIDEIILECSFVLQIRLRLAARDFVERRLRNVDVPLVDELRHLPVEKRQQQRPNMRAVDVGVGHDDDLVIPQLVELELVAPDTCAQRSNNIRHLFRGEHLVGARPLDVQDFTADRQHRLKLALAALFRRTACRVALDDENFRLRRVAILAFRKPAWQAETIERTLAPRQIAGLARRFASERRLDDLADDDLRFFRMLFEPRAELIADRRLDDRLHFGRNQLVLRLRRELRIGHFHRQNARQTFARIITRKRNLLFFRKTGFFRVFIDDTRQRASESGEMRAAVALWNVVREAQHRLVVGIVPPQSRLDGDAVLLTQNHDRIGKRRRLRTIEVAHERRRAAFVDELLPLHVGMTRIRQNDLGA